MADDLLTPRELIAELWAEDPTATPAQIRQRYIDHVRAHTETLDDDHMVYGPLREWLLTVVPDKPKRSRRS